MRSTITFALLTLLAVVGSGCRSTTIQCQREMALLRAEIIDLEDKYYALKSKYERDGDGVIISDGIVGSGIAGSPAMVTQYPTDNGNIIYSDQYVESPVGSGIYYETQPLSDQPVIGQPTLAPETRDISPSPTAVEPELIPDAARLPLQLSPDTEALPVPGDGAATEANQSRKRSDDFDLNVGFEATDRGQPEIDRIEILSQGTRGKDVDELPGDEGIELMITTVDANQNYVAATGELTVTVRDPAIGEIGKWTFYPKELELFFSRDEFGNRGLLLHLPWTEQMPTSSNIDIRVKILLNGIEYIASRRLKIEPPQAAAPADAIAGWSASESRWITSPRRPIPTLQASTARRESADRKKSQTIERPRWRPVR